MRSHLLLLALGASAKVFFKETFDVDPIAEGGWVVSDWTRDDLAIGKFTWESGPNNEEDDKGLRTSEDAKIYSISKKFDQFSNVDNHLVFQFQVRHPQDLDCGGGYIKLLGPNFDQSTFGGETDYYIMFGPDKCGYTKRTHVIINFEGENKLKESDVDGEFGLYSTVYRLEINPDSSYRVTLNGEEKAAGHLKDDWKLEQPKTIKDPEKPKPSDWVDEQEIDDPEDTKPEDWDQPAEIVDPEASKPDDWDDEDDGEWEAPMISNPDYKGTWSAKKIPNPDYKGEYVQPEIDNPDYKEAENAGLYNDIGGIGIEIWQVKSGTVFDNILVTDSVEEADAFVAETCADFKCGDAEKEKKEAADAAAEAERKAKEEAEAEAEDDDDEDDDETNTGGDDMAELEAEDAKEEL